MNIHPSYERIIKYAAGDTQDDADHIITCAHCGETVSSFRNVQALIRSDDFVTPPDRTVARAQAIFVPHRYKPRSQPMRFSWGLGFAMAVSSFVFFCVGVLFAQVTQSGITIVIGPRSPSAPAVIDVKPTQASGTAVIEFPRHTPIPTPQDQPPKVPKLLLPSDTEPESDIPLVQTSTTITLTVPVTGSLPVDVEPTPQAPVSPTPLPSTNQESPSQPPSAPPEPTSAPAPQPTSAPLPQPTSAPPPQPTSAPSPEPTSAPPPQPTSAPSPEPTSAPPPQPTSTPPPSKTPPVINPGQWNA